MKTAEEKKASRKIYDESRKAARREAKEKARLDGYGPLTIITTTPIYNLDFHYADQPTMLRELYDTNQRLCNIIRRNMLTAYGKDAIVVVDAKTDWVAHNTNWTAEITAKGVLKDEGELQAMFDRIAAEVISTAKIPSWWRRPSEAEDEMYDPKREI